MGASPFYPGGGADIDAVGRKRASSPSARCIYRDKVYRLAADGFVRAVE